MGALQVDTSGRGCEWGTGGMATKLTAARLAAAAPERVAALVAGQRVGTVFRPLPHALRRAAASVVTSPAPWQAATWATHALGCAPCDGRKSSHFAAERSYLSAFLALCGVSAAAGGAGAASAGS